MASMTMAAKVDVRVADGGLAQVYQIANVNPLLVGKLEEEDVKNLSDFTCLWTQADYEAETVEFRDKVPELQGKKVEVARLRTAILLARAVMERPAAPPSGESQVVDMEAPLEPGEKDSMAQAWTARYSLTLCMWLDPADPLVNRLFREFRANTPTLIPVSRIKSVYSDNNPNPERKVALAGGLTVTVEGRDKGENVRDVSSYYFSLRILANASAKAGNYEAESKEKEGKKVIFAPLDINLDYADFAFRMTLKQQGNAHAMLKWLLDRDQYTRGLMCNYMRRGYPQGEALTRALGETEIKWSSADEHPVQDGSRKRERSRTPPRAPKKPRQPRKKAKTVMGKTQQQSVQTRHANIAKGGKTICIGYNQGHCKGDQCQYGRAHVCSVIENGRACGLKHPAMRHNHGR